MSRRLSEDWQDPVEELPSRATSLQDMTALPGTILAEKVGPLSEVTLMGSLVEEKGGLDTKGPIQEQVGTEVSTNDPYVAPATSGSKEHLEASTCDLESQPNQNEEQISEESQSLKSQHTNEILLQTKEKPARRSNRRRKLRVYFP